MDFSFFSRRWPSPRHFESKPCCFQYWLCSDFKRFSWSVILYSTHHLNHIWHSRRSFLLSYHALLSFCKHSFHLPFPSLRCFAVLIIILARLHDVLWLDLKPWVDKRSGNVDLFITGSRQTLRDRATRWEQRAQGKEKEWKQSQNLINRVSIPANLEWNYQGHATGIFNWLRWEKNLKGNSSRSMNRENMSYTTVQCASSIQYHKEYAWPVGRGAASDHWLDPCQQDLPRLFQVIG